MIKTQLLGRILLLGGMLALLVSCGSCPALVQSRVDAIQRGTCDAFVRYCSSTGDSSHPIDGFLYTKDEKNMRCRLAKGTMQLEDFDCKNWYP